MKPFTIETTDENGRTARVLITPPSPLQLALADFNLVFGYDLRMPILPEHVEIAAEMAALRGRQDVADGLRAALEPAAVDAALPAAT